MIFNAHRQYGPQCISLNIITLQPFASPLHVSPPPLRVIRVISSFNFNGDPETAIRPPSPFRPPQILATFAHFLPSRKEPRMTTLVAWFPQGQYAFHSSRRISNSRGRDRWARSDKTVCFCFWYFTHAYLSIYEFRLHMKVRHITCYDCMKHNL